MKITIETIEYEGQLTTEKLSKIREAINNVMVRDRIVTADEFEEMFNERDKNLYEVRGELLVEYLNMIESELKNFIPEDLMNKRIRRICEIAKKEIRDLKDD